MRMGLSLALGAQRSGGGAAFGVSLTGLTNGEAIIGDHASIGYTTDPVSATETVKWSNSADPAAAATYGTGASPTDYTAGDEGRIYLHVTDGGETVTRSALIRYARGTAPAVADGQAWTVDDTSVSIDGSASGANLTFTYAISGLPASVPINASTGAVTGSLSSVGSGTATITATDQYGLTYSDTFTWSASLRTQATAAGGLGPFSFAQGVAVSGVDFSADFTTNGNTLTYTIAPALPAGLSLASNGIPSGTPTTLQSATSYTVTGQDEYGRDTDSTFTIAVTDAPAVDPLLTAALAASPTGLYTLTPDGDSELWQERTGQTTAATASSDLVGEVTNIVSGGVSMSSPSDSTRYSLQGTPLICASDGDDLVIYGGNENPDTPFLAQASIDIIVLHDYTSGGGAVFGISLLGRMLIVGGDTYRFRHEEGSTYGEPTLGASASSGHNLIRLRLTITGSDMAVAFWKNGGAPTYTTTFVGAGSGATQIDVDSFSLSATRTGVNASATRQAGAAFKHGATFTNAEADDVAAYLLDAVGDPITVSAFTG